MNALTAHTRQFFDKRNAALQGDEQATEWLVDLAQGKLGKSPCQKAAQKALEAMGLTADAAPCDVE